MSISCQVIRKAETSCKLSHNNENLIVRSCIIYLLFSNQSWDLPDKGNKSVFNFLTIFRISGQFFLQSCILIICPDKN